jgi:hypothetical protein
MPENFNFVKTLVWRAISICLFQRAVYPETRGQQGRAFFLEGGSLFLKGRNSLLAKMDYSAGNA